MRLACRLLGLGDIDTSVITVVDVLPHPGGLHRKSCQPTFMEGVNTIQSHIMRGIKQTFIATEILRI